MAGIHRHDMAEYIRHRQPTLTDAAVEIVLVALKRLSLIERYNIGIRELILVPVFLDGSAAAVSNHCQLCFSHALGIAGTVALQRECFVALDF